jgi:hypothetical protein
MQPCPVELGVYTLTDFGAGCGDLDTSAPQCIKATNVTCEVTLTSQQTANGTAVNGTVDLDMSGNFMNGLVKFGTVQRSGCIGTWSASMSQLLIDCGGMGSSQSCTAVLTRTGATCPF